MNDHTINGKMTEIKGKLQKTWGKITDDKVEEVVGLANQAKGNIEQSYGSAKDKIKEGVESAKNDAEKKRENFIHSKNI